MRNPPRCEGQSQAGIAHGLGQALWETLVCDPQSGQLVTGSFQDYCMPRADNFCAFELRENATPTDNNPLGVKAVGEAGTIGSIPAAVKEGNAALSRIGAPPVARPATPPNPPRAPRAPRNHPNNTAPT